MNTRLAAPAAIVTLLLSAGSAGAQNVTEPALKAAFVYNIAKFTEWPADVLPESAAFTVCVLGGGPVGGALEQSLKGRLLAGHAIAVTAVRPDSVLRSCHLLFLSDATDAQLVAIVAAVRDLPVLTISDAGGFDHLGGIAYLYVGNGNMCFNLNLDLARHARLHFSSRLLALAAHVQSEPLAPK